MIASRKSVHCALHSKNFHWIAFFLVFLVLHWYSLGTNENGPKRKPIECIWETKLTSLCWNAKGKRKTFARRKRTSEAVLMSILSCHISLKLSPGKFYVHTTISMRHCAIGSCKSAGWCALSAKAFQLYVRDHMANENNERRINDLGSNHNYSLLEKQCVREMHLNATAK